MTPHPLNPQGLTGQEEQEDRVGERVGGDGIYIYTHTHTPQTHACTILYKHNIDTIQKKLNWADKYTHVYAHMCVVR